MVHKQAQAPANAEVIVNEKAANKESSPEIAALVHSRLSPKSLSFLKPDSDPVALLDLLFAKRGLSESLRKAFLNAYRVPNNQVILDAINKSKQEFTCFSVRQEKKDKNANVQRTGDVSFPHLLLHSFKSRVAPVGSLVMIGQGQRNVKQHKIYFTVVFNGKITVGELKQLRSIFALISEVYPERASLAYMRDLLEFAVARKCFKKTGLIGERADNDELELLLLAPVAELNVRMEFIVQSKGHRMCLVQKVTGTVKQKGKSLPLLVGGDGGKTCFTCAKLDKTESKKTV